MEYLIIKHWIKYLLKFVSYRYYFPRKGSIAFEIKKAPNEVMIEVQPGIYEIPIHFSESVNFKIEE